MSKPSPACSVTTSPASSTMKMSPPSPPSIKSAPVPPSRKSSPPAPLRGAAGSVQQVAELIARDGIVAVISGAADAAAAVEQHQVLDVIRERVVGPGVDRVDAPVFRMFNVVPVDPGGVRVEAFVSIFNHHVVRVVDEVVVIAASATHPVGPATAVEHVVAFHAVHQVGLIVPVALVAIPRAHQVLDIDEDIALGVAARVPADQQEGVERDTHALVRVVVGRPIDAVAAIEPVGAGAAIEEIESFS